MEKTVLCTWAMDVWFPSLIYGKQSRDLFGFQSCCIRFLIPVALHVSCLFEIEKHFRHALWSCLRNAAQAELTAWAVRNFAKWNSAIKIRTINVWREFSCGIVFFLMFSSVPFSEWGHACGQLMSGSFGWLNNCDPAVVQELLSCPAAMPGSSPTPQLLEPCSSWPGRLQGVDLATRDELVSPGPAQSRWSTWGCSLPSSSHCSLNHPIPCLHLRVSP